MEKTKLGLLLTVLLIGFVLLTSQAAAVAPHPDLIEKWRNEGVLEQKLANLRAFREAGGCSAEEHTPLRKDRFGGSLALGTDLVDTANIIVILVDFSDNVMSAGVATEPYQFDSVLFSDNYNPTGSMTDFYKENSYGNFVVKGDILGPYRMPRTYSYYVGTDDGLGRGSELAGHALDSARNHVSNWRRYDSNYDDICDGFVIIHAGRGAEAGAYGIWSHKGNINAVTIDGVRISPYTMNPEETGNDISPIGVFAHEYGHFLGLPDLYDVSETPGSMGLGRWALMATGSYNGGGSSHNARQPSHLTAWSKAEVGFLNLVEIDENMSQVEFPHVEENPVAYKLQNSHSGSREYWIVENRQEVGFDEALPSWGLCIYHIDNDAPGPSNQNPNQYHVAMEQADGNNSLAFGGSNGDPGDVWPGATGAREFHDLTTPNTHTNLQGGYDNDITTRIGLWNISNSGLTMTADLDVDWSRPWPALADQDSIVFDDSQPGGNGDGIFLPGETISFYCTMKNLMRLSYNATIRLESNNPAITFITDQVLLSPQLGESDQMNLTPITFRLAASFVPTIDSIFLILECDSIAGIPYDNWTSQTFGLEISLGPPQVLVVDDDRGANHEDIYTKALHDDLRLPYAVWHKANKSSPSGDELKKYPMVFWHTGDWAENVFTAADVAAMKEYLDAGGNLLISSISGATSLNDLDADFLRDYLGASLSGSMLYPQFAGVTGNQLGDGTKYRYMPTALGAELDLLTPVSGGEAAFTFNRIPGIVGVTQQTTYNSILVTFPIEYLDDQFTGFNTKAEFFTRVIDFFGGIPLGVDDGSPNAALPKNFDLSQNYPNPFNPATTISYTLRPPTDGQLPKTNLAIYNLLGRRVVTLVDKIQLPGTYEVEWAGATENGQAVASGVYFYKLSRGDDSQSKKMILLK